ncbi:TIGR01244 family sulfur transferase [Methylobacterium gossipiicola]|uniref:TIGR01244 family protein n=1 Tax=Methylobacterium gossipiicola TaxID=582675 RepID=A0A1I2U9J4_9HYPH|nr:TIGR01244 family sulfur transferase [Methylobacterium gossipiicola]SFG73824.1 TIGR01244 family protein [Methylobacterium gossipiicola]
MRLTRIDDTLSVASQPTLSEIEALKDGVATALINNRPDGEEPGLPGTAAEAEAARAAGLAYHHIPVTGPTLGRAEIDAFRAAVRAAPGPVVAHCRSGTRSLTLHVLGEVLDGRLRRDEVAAFGTRHGFDLSGAVAWLDANAPDTAG